MLNGVAYLHSKGIVHRDLKLENLLLGIPGNITQAREREEPGDVPARLPCWLPQRVGYRRSGAQRRISSTRQKPPRRPWVGLPPCFSLTTTRPTRGADAAPTRALHSQGVKIVDFGLAKKATESAMRTVCGTPMVRVHRGSLLLHPPPACPVRCVLRPPLVERVLRRAGTPRALCSLTQLPWPRPCMCRRCPPLQYVAPEVVNCIPGLMYGEAVDLWSAGVILFMLLSARAQSIFQPATAPRASCCLRAYVDWSGEANVSLLHMCLGRRVGGAQRDSSRPGRPSLPCM